MRLRPLVVGLTALAIVSATAALVGCSKDKGTNPPPPTTESFDSGTLSADFTHTFTTAGTFGYRCKFHGGSPYFMTGTVIVDPLSSTMGATVNVNSFAFTPPSVTIKTGTTVTWHLIGGTHTATRP